MRPARLSIRATLLAGIVLGMLLPAAVVLVLDAQFARRTQQPIIERNRAAVMVLATAVLTEPAWTLSEPALEAAVARVLEEPSVCAVEVMDLQPATAVAPLRRDNCAGASAVVTREAPVLHEGQTIARLRLSFDDGEIGRLLAERRAMTTWLVALQVLFGVAVMMAVMSLRLLRPIDALKRQAGRLAAREPETPPAWSGRDELGELGQHLNSVHAQIRDLIGELERKNAELERAAMYDHLTALPNRRLMRELFAHAAATARRESLLMAVLFVDLDRFKSVNDQHGHAAGDELLVAVSGRLRDVLRESDTVCRLGGDEFVVLLPRVDGWEQACATADRVLRSVQQPLLLSGAPTPVHIGASIGIAMYPGDGTDFDALVRAADVAMYRSKDMGRGRHSLYRPEMDAALQTRLRLERELGDAVAQGQLRLYLQPMLDARDGRILGAEALVRWQHPQRGLLGPDGFIGAAEATGAIRPLGQWVLEAACAELAAWRARGRQDLHVAVNVSALQLQDPAFVDIVLAATRSRGLPPGALTLELTESVLLGDSAAAIGAVQALREAGVRLAIDDFGTGYSSLSALKRVRPDLLKIDRGFVRDLPGSHDDCALAEAVLHMAAALGIEAVAEGVETPAQRDWLLSHGGWRQQGDLWARPMPAPEFRSRLALRTSPGHVG